jgi:hypothetical protein
VLRAIPLLLVLAILHGCGGDEDAFSLGPNAQLDWTPASVVFGDVPRGGEARRYVTLRHTGTSGVILLDPIRLVTDSEDLSIGLIESTALEPGQESRIQIIYNSNHDAQDLGTLEVGLNLSAMGLLQVPISTPGQRAKLIAVPATVDFGVIQAGAADTIAVNLTNVGTAPAVLESGSVVGDEDGDFAVDVTKGVVIDPGKAVSVDISYDPTGQDSDDALVIIGTDRADVSVNIEVEGEEESPVLVVEPATVQFGWVEPGGSKLVTLRLTNEGNIDLVVEDIELLDVATEGLGLVNPPQTPFTLAPGDLVKMGALFAPLDTWPMAGEPLATMRVISTDDAHSPFDVPLYGAAGVPGIFVSPEDVVDFAYVAEGFSAQRVVTVLNVGEASVVIEDAVLDEATTSEFGFESGDDLPAELKPGESVQLSLRFHNQGGDEGTEYARFTLFTTDSLVPQYPLNVVARRSERPTCEPVFVPELLSMGAFSAESSGVDKMYIANYGSGNCVFKTHELVGCQKIQFDVRHRFDCDKNWTWTPFEIVGAPLDGQVLGPGDIGFFDVQFNAPPIYNEILGRDHYFARLTALLHDPNENQYKYLAPPGGWMAGINLRAESALPIVGVDPGDIAFGLVRTGCESHAAIVTVSNLGPMVATVTALAFEGCNGQVVAKNMPSLPYAIDGYEALYLELAFAPDVGGEQSCSLHVETNSMNVPVADIGLAGAGIDVDHQVDVFKQLPTPKVDVLFVVDDSGSMADEQQMLKTELPKLASLAAEWGQDYHMAVTTTDTYGLKGQFKGNPPYVTSSDPTDLFAGHLIVGTSGHWKEMGLEGGWMGLNGSNVSSTEIACENKPNACPSNLWCIDGYCRGPNWGFLRPDADLVVIIVSDEEDSSPNSVAWYVTRFAALKAPQSGVGVKLHAIVYTLDGCLGGKWGTPGTRYIQAVAAFDGHVASICSTDFEDEFEDIGAKTFGLKDQFYPSLPPDPETIVVRVNGSTCTSGWVWNTNTSAVVFDADGSCFPPYDADIEIEYDVICQVAAP